MTLKKGDLIPDVTLKDHEDNIISLQSLAKEKPLVIYFYPKNDTPGCTAEACSFRDHYQEFSEAGSDVVGISSDSVTSHQRVREKRNLPFRLLSDPDHVAEKAFGVPRKILGLLPGRVTFVCNTEGRIVYVFNSSWSPRQHISEALTIVKSL